MLTTQASAVNWAFEGSRQLHRDCVRALILWISTQNNAQLQHVLLEKSDLKLRLVRQLRLQHSSDNAMIRRECESWEHHALNVLALACIVLQYTVHSKRS